MNNIISFFLSVILLLMFACMNKTKNSKTESFSTKELEEAGYDFFKDPGFFESEGNVRIAYFPFLSKNEKANLIVIHGGGAHSNAGYQFFAEELSKKYNISTYLMDLRGHGLSGDERGDAIEVEYVYKDIQKLIEIVKSKSKKSLFLCGHSSGSGVILNYLSYLNSGNITGFIFISPEFGYKSSTKRDNIKEPFAKPKTYIFKLSGISGKRLFKHTTAVNFNYPPEILERDKLLVNFYTTNMAYACTPDNPKEQFKKVDKPVLLLIGQNDELLDPEKIKKLTTLLSKEIRNKSNFTIIPDANHLSVLLHCENIIGNHIFSIINR